MKKDIKNVKKLRLNRESLHELDLRTATGGATAATAAANTCHVDCSFIYTGCHGTCNCTTTA